MLTPNEIYTKLLFKLNKNDTNSNIKIPKGVFVILFNEQKRKYLDKALANEESSDLINNFSEILALNTPLTKVSESTLSDSFKLPADFLKEVSSYSLASKNKCNNSVITNWFIKPKDINVLLQNVNHKPSFEYQETLAIINNNNISIYKEDFKINKTFLSYYKNPPDLDIEGYIKPDGTKSQNISTTLSDTNIDKILDRTVVEISSNYQSVEQLQLALQRQQTNEQYKN